MSVNRKAGGAWKETRHDKFYHLAKEQGYRSRAAFKLIQLNKKYDFLSSCKSIVDLGAAPGGWLQVAQKYMPVSSLIIGVDLLPIRPIRGVTALQADITTENAKKLIKQELQSWDVDVVMHDGAPNVAGGGSWTKDAYVQNELVIHSLRLATTVLRQGGWFITKIFRSQDYNSLLWVLQQFFKKVEVSKPAASRNASAEIFCVCQGYLAPKKIDAKLLDPNVIFQQFDDESSKKKPDVFSNKQPKRVRTGYDDVDNMTQTKKLDILQFLTKDIDQTTAIRYLGDYNQFTFEKAPTQEKMNSLSKDLQVQVMSPEEREKHDALLEIVLSHSATTSEIRELTSDLKVLGKGDLRALLRYRREIQTYLDELELEEKKKDGRWEAEENERKAREAQEALEAEEARVKYTPEEQLRNDLKDLRMKKLLEAKKSKKVQREKQAKQAKRHVLNAHNMKESGEITSSGIAGVVGGEDSLFSLNVIKNKDSLDYVAETEGKGKIKKSDAAAAVADEDGDDLMDDEDADEDEETSDVDESELYRTILQQQSESFDISKKKNKTGIPSNMYEDTEEAMLSKLRERDSKRTGDYTSTDKIGINNIRGEDDDESYYNKLEKDLDWMYQTYKDRRDIKTKNRTGNTSELILNEETTGTSLLTQAKSEEKTRLGKESKKRKRDKDDSDTDSDEDNNMDRFNSESDDEEDEEDDEDEEEGEKAASASSGRAASADSDDDDEENSNPLIHKVSIPKPSNSQRMNRWFQRGLLGDMDTTDGAEERKDGGDDEDEEEEESKSNTKLLNKKGSKKQQQKVRKMVDIDAGAPSSDEEDDGDVDMTNGDAAADGDDDEDASGSAATFFSNGKQVRTKSGLKPNTVRGLDGLRTAVKKVQDDVIQEEKKDDSTAASSKKKGKKGEKRVKKPEAPQYDEDGDLVDSLKQAEKDARARLKKTNKNYKAQEKSRNEEEKEKKETYEEVALQEDDELADGAHYSSDDDAIAERLALGRHMLSKKTRNTLINDSYNRYSLDVEELQGLPEWFVRDESQHHTPILPVTKAEVDTYKEQLRAINTRPIKKIAEAKARKQVKTQKRWEKIKAQAEVIANASEGAPGDKLRQIEKLFHQKSLKKEKKERVYVVTQKNGRTVTPKSSSGRKGRIVKVDTRMKKDKRGEKKAEQRNKKAKSNKNKKQRNV